MFSIKILTILMVSMRVACCYLLSQVMFDWLIKFILGRTEDSYEHSEQKRGSGDFPAGKIVLTTPIRSLENAQSFGGFAV